MALALNDILAAVSNAWFKVRQLSVLGDIDCNNITVRRKVNAFGVVPIGGAIPFWGTTPPTGWLIADGSSFDGGVYPALQAQLGGTTLPDLRGRTVHGTGSVGTNSQPSLSLGNTGGEQNHTLSVAELANHSHSHNHGSHNHGPSSGAGFVTASGSATAQNLESTQNASVVYNSGGTAFTTPNTDATAAGSNSAHNTMSPYIAMLWIIRAQ